MDEGGARLPDYGLAQLRLKSGLFLEFHNERVDVCTNDRVYKTLIANFGLLVTALTLSTVHDSSNSHCFSHSWSTQRNSTSN